MKPTCLDPKDYESVVKITDSSLCIVAMYTAAMHVGFDASFAETSPTWGKHNGPLTMAASGANVTLTRWDVPNGATGALAPKVGKAIDAAVPQGTFFNAAANDLLYGGFNLTVVGWSQFGGTAGEAILLNEPSSKVEDRHNVTGFYGLAAFGGANKRRWLTASFSAVGKPEKGAAGVYVQDSCDGKVTTHSLDVLGDASGPVALDDQGNFFAIYPSIAKGTQSLRGYSAASVTMCQAPGAGEELFSIKGSGGALAAKAPSGASDGYVLFTPGMLVGNTYTYQNVIAQRYAVTGGKVVKKGEPADAIAATTKPQGGADIRLMLDDKGRIWASLVTDKAKPQSTFFVLDRK
jgi:hypothetical protein